MDNHQDNDRTICGQAEPVQPQPVYIQMPKEEKKTARKALWAIFITLSVLANILLFFALLGLGAFFAVGQDGILAEELIEPGPHTNKIAIVNLREIIDDRNAKDFHKQLKKAGDDEYVKGIIVRVNSPGGSVSSSDRIYKQILEYKDRTKKPVVSFMEGMAASGGYYTAVAGDRIVAEPTAITGSIGVLFGQFIVQQLMEEKLGIKPVIIKSGEKKDWLYPFADMTPEQIQYIEEKLINPAYERFVRIVADQRPELSVDDVKSLADGSIYTAPEALDEKMIDEIGYLDGAIKTAKKLANITQARVVEYKKPFSFADFLRSQQGSLLKIDKSAIYELASPQLMYLWTIY